MRDLEIEDGLKSLPDDKDNEPPPDPDDRHANIRSAKLIKRKRQDTGAEKMVKRREQYMCNSGASIGAVVRVSNDERDVKNARSTLGVIFEMAEAGGVLICTEWGVLVFGVSRKDHWVASDRYEVLAAADDDDVVISSGLEVIRNEIRSGEFDRTTKKKVTLQESHKRFVGSSPIRATQGCRCGKGTHGRKTCTSACGCIKNKVGCTSKCICNGNCTSNRYNNK